MYECSEYSPIKYSSQYSGWEYTPIELSIMPFLSDRGVYKSWLNKNKYIKQQVYREKKSREFMDSTLNMLLPKPNVDIKRLLPAVRELPEPFVEVPKPFTTDINPADITEKEIDDIIEKEIDDILNTAYNDMGSVDQDSHLGTPKVQDKEIETCIDQKPKYNVPKAKREKTCIEIEDIFAYKKLESRPLDIKEDIENIEEKIKEELSRDDNDWCIL